MNIEIPSQTLMNRLQKARDAYAEVVLGGSLSPDDYRTNTGFIRGLDYCIAEIEDLARVQKET